MEAASEDDEVGAGDRRVSARIDVATPGTAEPGNFVSGTGPQSFANATCHWAKGSGAWKICPTLSWNGRLSVQPRPCPTMSAWVNVWRLSAAAWNHRPTLNTTTNFGLPSPP